ncbi:MAG: spore germination protein [Thermoclostridium sp.]|nr:spore germination protein [Thermoclostridium sp.]
MKDIKSLIKDIFLFHPENPKDPFILEEPQKRREEDEKEDIGKERGKEDDSSNSEAEKAHSNARNKENKLREQVSDKKPDQQKQKEKNLDSKKASEVDPADKKEKVGEEREHQGKAIESEAAAERTVKDDGQPGEKDKKSEKRGITQPIPLAVKDLSEKEEKRGNEKDRGDIHTSVDSCLQKVKQIYTADINGDFKVREFHIRVKDEVYKAFACFFDGMVDRTIINTTILQPLMTLSVMPMDTEDQSVEDVIYNHLIPQNQIKKCKTYQEVVDEVNFGGIAIFIDSLGIAIAGDVKGWEHRTIEKPTSELNIRGPKEAFNETNRVNTALLRKTLKDENLIVEDVLVGTRSKTPCSMVYIKNIANSSLVDEVRKRLKSIQVGYLQDSGELEQMLEDSTFLPAPQMLLTERPDTVAAYLGEGRVGIIVHGSPFVIIAPVTLFNLIHSPEDYYLRYPYATLLRFIRVMGILFTLLLPALYLAVTTFHQEMLPTDLLLAIASSREKVPFPTIVSILIMEISFELIREAGIRIPGPIGTTLGIVGALILGQAAVSANLVSPILIIIIAVTAIGSFAIPDFSLGYSFRTLRFIYLLLAGISGLLGIALCLFVHLLFLVHARSFGVPFLVPYAPKTTGKRTNTIFKTPLWKEEDRPDFLNPKAVKKQPTIARGWVKEEKGVESDEPENENR